MKKQHKKMIAPIVIAVILCSYCIGLAVVCALVPIPVPIKLLLAIIPLALAGVSIFVFIERIKEIRSGEEDDLSKY